MRLIHTGLNADGRSCVTREDLLDPARARLQELYAVAPGSSSPPPGSGAALALEVPPGAVRWMLVRWAPGFHYGIHHTDTIDLHLVLEGGADLLLDDESVRLRPGDAVAITGVDHGWQAGPHGCTIALLLVGTTPHSGPRG
jgi:quercetin dioxygenase-like cupin family protein